MKPTLTILTALLLAPLAALHAKDEVTNVPATGDVRDVRVIRTADQEPRASLLGQPTIALWKEKHLVVAYQKGIAGKTDMGSIDAIVSSNDGDSWSIPSTIFDHEQRHGAMQFGYCNAVLYHPPGQEVLWCFAMRCPLNYADSEDSHLAAAYSGDGGRSWNPVELAMHYTGPLVILGEI
ncbi:MAG: sialidase family protein, partial [Planctomycetota bacterium]|nr:sialidase family protein [Planctomycetota bacterium]